MNNRGNITVFLCLLLSGMLLIIFTAMNIINKKGAQAKIAICARSAVSDIKSQYNRYLFEHYHILLFDRNCSGYGEGVIESVIEKTMQENLGDEYEISTVRLSDFAMIYDENGDYLLGQIKESLPYMAGEYGVDKILEATQGKDGTLTPKLDSDLKKAVQAKKEEPPEELAEDAVIKDPRKDTSKMSGGVLQSIVVPEGMELSDYTLTWEDHASLEIGSEVAETFFVSNDFQSISVFEKDLKSNQTWSNDLVSTGVLCAYAPQVFNCATEQEVNSTAVLKCELEYLICGQANDKENLEQSIERIIAIRMPVNYAFLMTDPEKKSMITSIATPIAAVSPLPLVAVEQLITGSWAYGEAVAEVKELLRGKRLSFTKSNANWITDINRLGETVGDSGVSDPKGLSYKDYLIILLAMEGEDSLYRMFDLFQLNARTEDETFRIINGAIALQVDLEVEFDGSVYYLQEKGFY